MIEHSFYKGYFGDEEGNIYSNKYGYIKKLKKNVNKYGYEYVRLSKDKKAKHVLVHRFICSIFKLNELNKEQVNHIDGNKKNNRIDNLEWVTAKENTDHAFNKGLRDFKTLKENGMRLAKRISQIDIKTGEVIRVWESSKEPGRILGEKFNSPAILRCCKLIKNTHKGFIWRFEGEEDKIFENKKRESKYKVVVYMEKGSRKEFENVQSFCVFFGIKKSSAYRCLNEGRLLKGKYRCEKIF